MGSLREVSPGSCRTNAKERKGRGTFRGIDRHRLQCRGRANVRDSPARLAY
jgi:hypothetical protein